MRLETYTVFKNEQIKTEVDKNNSKFYKVACVFH